MYLNSSSFQPYDILHERLAFGKYDASTKFTFAGNRNPHLQWGNVPEGTRSFALLCFDSDVPSVPDNVNQEGKYVALDLPRVDFFHWVLIDLPAHLREIEEGSHSEGVAPKGKPLGTSPSGGLQGLNDFTHWFAGDENMGGEYAGYDGAAPPWNDERIHGYRFTLYALSVDSLGLQGSFGGKEVQKAMQGKILGQVDLVGLYAINPNARKRHAQIL